MNYKVIALVTGGIMLGALTFSAIGVSALGSFSNEANGERQGRVGAGVMEHRTNEGKKYAAEVLGLTPEEIRAQIQSGKTMEEVVLAQGYEDIESFKAEVETKVREMLAEQGLSQEEIDAKIEDHQNRRDHRKEHMRENFKEDDIREHMSDRGLSENEVNERINMMQDRLNSFSN